MHFSGGAVTAPLPPVLVTVGDGERSNIITIGWTGILATVPPRTYISVRPKRYSYELLKKSGEFVINLAPSSLAREVDFCGIYTGAKVDKFEKCSLTRCESRTVAPPTVAECPIALECRVAEVIPMGSHDVFVADILSVSCDESVYDEDGKIRFDKADLLAYAHGEYYKLGEVIGRFGFSTAKKAKNTSDAQKAGGRVKNTHVGEDKNASADGRKTPFYADIAKKKKPHAPSGKRKGRGNGGRKA